MQILLVEDDIGIREALREMLEDEGYHVTDAVNGRDALSKLNGAATLPQLILLDLSMPIMSGWAFRDVQRQDARLDTIPVVIFSADRRAEQIADQLGVAGCIEKPIDIDLLLELVAQHVSRA